MRTSRNLFLRCLVLGGAWMVLCFLVLPLLIIVPVSFTDRNYLSLPEQGLSLQYYRAFFTSWTWLYAAFQSLVIAVASTILAVVIGGLCAIGCWRVTSRLSEFVRLVMLLPLIVPTIVQGLALYRFFVDIGLMDSYTGAIVAHTVIGIPYVMVTTAAALAGFDLRLEQAARSLGATPIQGIRYVIIPSIWPGLLAGATFAFTHSFDELVIALFIISRRIYTVPKRIWDGIQNHVDPIVAVVAVLLILATFVGLLISMLWERRRNPRPSAETT